MILGTRFCTSSLQPLIASEDVVKNHQKWTISRRLGTEAGGAPSFHLKDPDGCTHTAVEFIAENVEAEFQDTFIQLSGEGPRSDELVRNYLQKRLSQATPYQVHIERYNGKWIIRLGDYGLKGGGKKTALATSAVQIITGVALSVQGDLVKGATLLSAGLSGGSYALRVEEEQYTNSEYVRQTGCGAITGLVSGNMGTLSRESEGMVKCGWQIVNGFIGNFIGTITNEVTQKKCPEIKSVCIQACIGGIGGCVGAVANVASGTLSKILGDQATGSNSALDVFAKRSLEGGMSSASSKLAMNICEGQDILDGVIENGVMGGVLSGSIAAAEIQRRLSIIQRAQQGLRTIQDPLGTLAKLPQERLLNEQRRLEGVVNRQSQAVTRLAQQSFIAKDTPLSFQQASAKTLKTALSVEPPIEITDCSLQELIPHVVLVHCLTNDTADYYPEYDRERGFIDLQYQALCTLKGGINPLGTVGYHLENLPEKEFSRDSLVRRPHVHWAWNQMVQPIDAINSWESSRIALLEPLETFESTLYHRPLGVAPYDTFTLGAHRLSKKSLLLVPRLILEEAQHHFKDFQGTIVPFDGLLRPAIIDCLKKYYPNAWHACDENGHLIGRETQSFESCPSKTCTKKSDNQVIVLLEGQKTSHSQAIEEYDRNKRHIGFHCSSVTYWTDSICEEYPKHKKYFDVLSCFKGRSSTVKNHPLFPGGIKEAVELSELGSLVSSKFYRQLYSHDPKTNAQGLADLILNEALYADLVSLFYKTYPEKPWDQSALDVKILLAPKRLYLSTLLDDINSAIKNENTQRAFEYFEIYCSLLQNSLKQLFKIKQQVETLLNDHTEDSERPSSELKPHLLCLEIAQEEWNSVQYQGQEDFDLSRCCPQKDSLILTYVDKMLRVLPTDPKQLEHLHKKLSFFEVTPLASEEEKKEGFRRKVIRSVIHWSLIEKLYCSGEPEQNCCILAHKLSKAQGSLIEYALVAEDYTRNVGDCLFDNVAIQRPGEENQSIQLRLAVVKFMEGHQEKYSSKPDYAEGVLRVGDGTGEYLFDDWASYLEGIKKEQVWATELEIDALAHMLEVPFVVFSSEYSKPRIYNADASEKDPIFLHHVNQNHFEACVPFKGLELRDIYEVIKIRGYN